MGDSSASPLLVSLSGGPDGIFFFLGMNFVNMGPMSPRVRNWLIDRLGRPVIWLWFKSTRMKIEGEERVRKLRDAKRGIVHIIWHGRSSWSRSSTGSGTSCLSSAVPGRRDRRPGDGRLGLQDPPRLGKPFHEGRLAGHDRGAQSGGEVIIIPDGPKGPDRKLKMGCVRLAAETGAAILPFSFTTNKKKILKSWTAS